MKQLPIFGVTFFSLDGNWSMQPVKAQTSEQAIAKFKERNPKITNIDEDCEEIEPTSKLFRLFKSNAI